MPRKKIPAYRKQKRKGQPALAFSEVNGQRRYHGTFGSEESKARYQAFLVEFKETGALMHTPDLSIAELIDRYWTYAQTRYRRPRTPEGKPTTELDLVRRALKVLNELYAELPAAHFSPLKLKAVRRKMIDQGWCRKVVNDNIHRVRRCFGWGVENELVAGSVFETLKVVKSLERNHPGTRETLPVKPVDEKLIAGVLDHVAPPVKAMIQLQLLTAARPGELCIMRAIDIDRSNPVWIYRPSTHKTEYRGHVREVYLGPQARVIVEKFLKPDLTAYLFTPADGVDWHRQQRHLKRKTPAGQGNEVGDVSTKRPKWAAGDCYSVGSYRRAIAHACRAAFKPTGDLAKQPKETAKELKARLTPAQKTELKAWRKAHTFHPHQLRHNAATNIRAQYGIEMASILLGHRAISVTELYAEKNMEKARETIAKIG